MSDKASPAPIEAPPPHTLSELQDRLDSLWERQLELMEQYHQSQQQLQRHLSSGFFSLAQANFKSSSRIRYGQDYYDQRMRAARRFECTTDAMGQPRLASTAWTEESTTHDDGPDTPNLVSGDKHSGKTTQQPTPPATPVHQPDPDNRNENSEQPSRRTKKSSDPLHWYGILVPPALRQAQASFVSLVEGPVAEAANSAQALRKGEVEIRKLRKDIRKAEKKTSSI
ncbi:hypothetical protein MBLNU459_g2400t1 [Dothideomycetes sp. NU459]